MCRCSLPPHPSPPLPQFSLLPACCCSLRCGFSGNDRIRSSRLKQIVCINGDDSLAYGTHVGLPARGELVYSRPCRAATRTSNVSLVFHGKPEGNLRVAGYDGAVPIYPSTIRWLSLLQPVLSQNLVRCCYPDRDFRKSLSHDTSIRTTLLNSCLVSFPIYRGN